MRWKKHRTIQKLSGTDPSRMVEDRGRKVMRALLQAIVLATASLVTLAMTPSAADAQWQRHSSPWYSYPPGPMYSAPGAGAYGQARARLRVRIGLYDNFFMPATITVSPGTRVRWVNF